VRHPKTRFVSFTGSRDVGVGIHRLAGEVAPGQIWLKRVVAEMGGKDAIIVDEEADVDSAAQGWRRRRSDSRGRSAPPARARS
jgi:1-pyrroline-5-carboxylate dehydrogenase